MLARHDGRAGEVSIAVGLTAMVISIVLGTLVGVLAGYFRRLDGPLMRLTDLFLALPLLPLLLLVMVMLFRDPLAQRAGARGRDLPADRLGHRHHQLDAMRPHRARRGDRAEGTGIRARRPLDRHAAVGG